jgi:hypothetical protein
VIQKKLSETDVVVQSVVVVFGNKFASQNPLVFERKRRCCLIYKCTACNGRYTLLYRLLNGSNTRARYKVEAKNSKMHANAIQRMKWVGSFTFVLVVTNYPRYALKGPVCQDRLIEFVHIT